MSGLWAAGEGKMFSPGNLRATFDNPNYERLLSHYIGEKYTLRYTGGMARPATTLIWLIGTLLWRCKHRRPFPWICMMGSVHCIWNVKQVTRNEGDFPLQHWNLL